MKEIKFRLWLLEGRDRDLEKKRHMGRHHYLVKEDERKINQT